MKYLLLLSLAVSSIANALLPPTVTIAKIAERSATVHAIDTNPTATTVFLYIDSGANTDQRAISSGENQTYFHYVGLIPHQDYRFLARACDTQQRCSEYSVQPFTTQPATPSKPVSQVRYSATANSMIVQFNAPSESNHKDGISGYQLQLFRYDEPRTCFADAHAIINISEAQYEFRHLLPQTRYLLCIRSVNPVGPGVNPTSYVRHSLSTLADNPAEAPVIQEIVSDRQLTLLRWQKLTHTQARGKVIANDIRYRVSGELEWQKHHFPGNGHQAAILVRPYQEGQQVEFAIRSHTSAGPGPWSNVLGNDDNAL